MRAVVASSIITIGAVPASASRRSAGTEAGRGSALVATALGVGLRDELVVRLGHEHRVDRDVALRDRAAGVMAPKR